MTAIALDERIGIRLPPEAGAATIPAGQTVVGLAGLRVRQLGASDLPSVERHLVQLEPSDRRARFLCYRSDAAIAAYVRGIDPSCTVLVGAFDPSDRMVGLAEAHPTDTPRTVEVAVSIDPAFRRRGLGQRLVARALAVAFDRGMQWAEFFFAPNNCALAGLVETLGGRITAPGHALIERSQIVWNARQPETRRRLAAEIGPIISITKSNNESSHVSTKHTIDVQNFINSHTVSRFQKLVIVLCFAVVAIDGFDTAAVGFVAPVLKTQWNPTPVQLAPLFGSGLFGFMIGAFVFGSMADKIGRKAVLVAATLFFGLASIASAFSGSIEMLTALRFVTGLGLGGAMPAAITLTSEFCPERERSSLVTLMFCGFTSGSAAAGLLGSHVVTAYGWQGLLVLGGILTGVSWANAFGRVDSVLGSTVGGFLLSIGWDSATVFSVAAIPAFVAGAAMLAKAWLYASAPIIAKPVAAG
jgi:AAHS family 4-hydroxybenzoate transporter-like MFS transporter